LRGEAENQADMFSYLSPAARVPADHPLRPIRAMAAVHHDFLSFKLRQGLGLQFKSRTSARAPRGCDTTTWGQGRKPLDLG